jgi:hypothetical protein
VFKKIQRPVYQDKLINALTVCKITTEWSEYGDFYPVRSRLLKTIKFTINGRLHNHKGPALLIYNKDKAIKTEWWIKGYKHREDGPAVLVIDYDTGLLESYWYKNGSYHRDDGPAYIHPEVDVWFRNGKIHRTDGPAVVHKNGSIMLGEKWYINGDLIRYNNYTRGFVYKWYENGKVIRTIEDAPKVDNIVRDMILQ